MAERVGGRNLESFPVEGAEGASGDRGDGEEAEGRQGAGDERKEQEDREASGSQLGGPAAFRAALVGETFERRCERRAVAEVIGERVAERLARITPSRPQRVDGLDRGGSEGELTAGFGERRPEGWW